MKPSFRMLWVVGVGMFFVATTASADLFHSPKFKSPAGKFEVIFASASAATVPFSRSETHTPVGQKPQYVLLFYVAGGSEPVSADWYSDVDSAATPAQVLAGMLWGPGEEHVVVTHGLNAKTPSVNRWLISLSTPAAYGFEGTTLKWVDHSRLVADLQTQTIPGGIELVNAAQAKAELLISPHAGLGYAIAAVNGPRVTVKNYLNHWDDAHDKTTWEVFEPACFDLNLDTLKKRTVPCPK